MDLKTFSNLIVKGSKLAVKRLIEIKKQNHSTLIVSINGKISKLPADSLR